MDLEHGDREKYRDGGRPARALRPHAFGLLADRGDGARGGVP
jgi:hypothetical protein